MTAEPQPDIEAQLAESNLTSARAYFGAIVDALAAADLPGVQREAEFMREELVELTDAERRPVVAEVLALIESRPEAERGLLFELTGIECPAPTAPDALALGVLDALVIEAQNANGDRPQILERLARRLASESPLIVGDFVRRCAALDLCNASDLRQAVTACRRADAGAVRERRAAEQAENTREQKRDLRRAAAAPNLPAAEGPADELPYALTDLGNAERLAAWHGDTLKFVPELGYLVWGGRRWERGETAAQRMAKETVRGIYAEASRGGSDDERKAISEWAVRSESQARIAAMLTLAQSEVEIEARAADFDADPLLLNCQNGTLDLRTGALRPHSPADRLTKTAGTLYDGGATCDLWRAFLWRIFDGNEKLIAFIRRVVGYSLTGDTGEQCLFIPWGSGANGKSTLLETLRALFGDYGQQAEFSAFLARQSDTVRNDLARMVGARFIAAIESGEGRRLAEPVIKALTGGDTITARFLFKEYFEFKPTFKLWLATNHKPVIRGTDLAIWRRIRLIPFTVTIPEGERDPRLPAKLRDELPGILAWAVAGCLEWQREGLGVPAEVKDATEIYRAEQDNLAGFLRECCDLAGDVKASSLLDAYKAYSGEKITAKELVRLLTERGFTAKHTKQGNFWQGLSLVDLLSKGEG